METKQYVIVDLEMCRVPKDKRTEQYTLSNEIIEIGAALVNENLEITKTFKTYVAPEYGTLDNYIKKLTGISEKRTWKERLILKMRLNYSQAGCLIMQFLFRGATTMNIS